MGKYVNDNLGVDEKVLFETKLNYIMILIVLLGLLPLGYFFHTYFYYAFGIIFPIMYGYYYIVAKTSEFVVTTRKVFIKYGIISTTSLEINLDKIESIGVNQDLWGKIFGFGTIVVAGTGGTQQVFKFIDNPVEFRKNVSAAIDILNAKK